MILSYVHGGGAVPVKTKRVFFRTGTAREGFAVCYNRAALTVTAENEPLTTAMTGRAILSSEWSDARALMVEEPSYVNGVHFAGVVAKESHNVVGPNWITVNVPGSVCRVYSLASAGAGITATDPFCSSATTICNVLRTLTYTIACGSTANTYISSYNGAFVYAGYPGEGSAKCMEQVTAYHGGDTAWDSKHLVMAELMTGPPSGGVQLIAFGSSISSAVLTTDTDMDWWKVITPIGVSVITIGGCAPTTTVCGIITVGAGQFIGQKKLFYVPVVAAGTTPGLSNAKMLLIGSNSIAVATAVGILSTVSFGSTAKDHLEMMWTGGYWQIISLCTSATTLARAGN